MKEKDVKLLWGRAAARCALCRGKVTQDPTVASDALPLGEHAHIVGDKPTAARYDKALTDEERDGYSNRVLLCPNDHTLVDKDVAAWPTARLHMRKAEHELWVEQTLTTEQTVREQADALIYSTIIDDATEDLHLGSFGAWASQIPEPLWRIPGPVWDGIERFRHAVFTVDWPGTIPDLEIALDRASFELLEMTALFSQHSDLDPDGDFFAKRWYKQSSHPEDVRKRLASDFSLWSDTLEARLVEATKALNWVREIWRAEVNPMWLATQGWFVIQMWLDESERGSYLKPRYSEDEKATLRALGVGQQDVRAPSVKRRT